MRESSEAPAWCEEMVIVVVKNVVPCAARDAARDVVSLGASSRTFFRILQGASTEWLDLLKDIRIRLSYGSTGDTQRSCHLSVM